MKFEALQSNLKTMVSIVSKVVPAKPQLPILSTVLCKVENGEITLSATDLYLGIQARIPGSISEEGVVAIPGKTFADTISALSPETITIFKESDTTLQVQSPKTKTTLQCQPAEEFPAFPEIEGESISMSVETLTMVQSRLGFAASTDIARLVLTTFLLKPADSGVEAVATDGFRLARLHFKPQELSLEKEMLLPAAAINQVVATAKKLSIEEVKVTISDKQKQVFFELGDIILFVRLVEGQYPPYQKIIPSSFDTKVTVDASQLEEHLKQAGVMAREISNIVTFYIEETAMKVTVEGTTKGSFSAEIPLETKEGPDATIAFNSRYLLDFLSKTSPEQVTISLNDPLKPALFSHQGDDAYQYIVMPFKINA